MAVRDRRITLDGGAPAPLTEVEIFALVLYNANKKKNAAAKLERDALQRLTAAMAKAGCKKHSFEVPVTPDNGDLAGQTLTAAVEPSETKKVDLLKLKSLVSDEQFMEIVSATQSSVTNVAGGNTLAMVLKTEPGEEKVRVYKE